MRQHFGLRRRALRELISQRFGGATMQCLTAALQQILVSRVLDQRVLEAIFRLRRQAFDQEDVGFGEPFQGLAQWRLLHAGDPQQQRIGEAAPEHGADHRDLARGA